MNRFFSKLDLRDIRIDPRSSRFPPETETETEGQTDLEVDGPGVALKSHDPGDGRDQGVAPQSNEPSRSVLPWSETGNPDGDEQKDSSFAAEESGGRPTSDHGVSVDGGGDDVLKVSARSRPSAVAGAIAGVVRESGRAEVQAIGAGATNQAVKAVAIARDYLQETGIEVICVPAFIDVTIGDEDRTAIRLVVEPR